MGTKISQLPTGTIAGTDTVPVVKAGVTTAVPFSHTHPQSDVTSLTTALAGKADSAHTHAESDVTSLVTDLTTLQNKTSSLVAATPLDQSAWTWFNQGAATVTQSGNIVTFLGPTTVSGTNLRGRLRGSYPSTPFTLKAAVRLWCQVAGSITNLSMIGITVTDGTKHKIFVGANFIFTTATGPSGIWVGKYASATSATSATVIDVQIQNAVVYLKLVDDGTNQTFSYSLDDQVYVQVLQESRTTHLTPSDIGVVFTNQSASQLAGGSILSWSIA